MNTNLQNAAAQPETASNLAETSRIERSNEDHSRKLLTVEDRLRDAREHLTTDVGETAEQARRNGKRNFGKALGKIAAATAALGAVAAAGVWIYQKYRHVQG